MPIYEYQCESCGVVTDIKHGFKETTNESCPACSGALKRLFRPAGIVFKGSGFYVTDSRKASETKGDGSKSDGSKSDGSKSDGSKSDGSKSDGAKTETVAPKSDSGKSDSSSKGDSGGKGDAAA